MKNNYYMDMYSINYENIAFSTGENDVVDRASEWYYCLLRTTEDYKLVKLKEIDRDMLFPKKEDVKDICEYIDSIVEQRE